MDEYGAIEGEDFIELLTNYTPFSDEKTYNVRWLMFNSLQYVQDSD